MQSVDGRNGALYPSLVRTISRYADDKSQFKVHPAQAAAWEMCGICVTQIHIKPEELPLDIIKEQPRTMAGIPLIIDAAQPLTTVRLVNEQGETVAEIINLSVPNGFIQ